MSQWEKKRKCAFLKGLSYNCGWLTSQSQSADSSRKSSIYNTNFSNENKYQHLCGISTFSKLQTETSTISTPTTWIDEYNLLKASHISFFQVLPWVLFSLSRDWEPPSVWVILAWLQTLNSGVFLITHRLLAYWYSNKSHGATFKAPLNDALA